MAILDPNLLIYTAIHNALETEFSDNAIQPDCRIYWTGITGTTSPGKNVTGGGDYPQLTLTGATSGTGDLHAGDETFGTYSDTNARQTWLETSTWNYEIEIVSQGLSENEYTNLCARAVNGVRKAGAKLGLPWVTKVKYTFKTSDPGDVYDETSEDGIRRVVSKITVAVQTQIDGALLTGE